MSTSDGQSPTTTIPSTRKKEAIPRWVPICLVRSIPNCSVGQLALTTAALAVPIFILRRHRAGALSKALQDAAPPPRRTAAVAPSGLANTPLPSPPSPTEPINADRPLAEQPSNPEDDFNGALYSAKAFGIATAIVMAGGVVTAWGVKTAMGVQDTKEFADRMRQAVLTRMPVLSSRIHRPVDPKDEEPIWDPETEPLPVSKHRHRHHHIQDTRPVHDWSWPAAEERLKAAFDRDGFSGWAEAAAKEIEAEARIERIKRGHT